MGWGLLDGFTLARQIGAKWRFWLDRVKYPSRDVAKDQITPGDTIVGVKRSQRDNVPMASSVSMGLTRAGRLAGCVSADARRRHGLLAGEARKRMQAAFRPQASLRCVGDAIGGWRMQFLPTLHAVGARYTQFLPTLHASGARYTQFLRPRKLREASNAQVDEAALLSGPGKSCVHHASTA